MLKTNLIDKKIYLIGLHLLMGYLVLNPVMSKSIFLLVLTIGFMNILTTKNANNEAAKWSAYIVGAEVLFRMSKGLIFYEFPKYSVFIFLLTGLLMEKKRHDISPVFIIYILLLMIGIAFSDIPFPESIRTNIIFNLSGPILLGFCAMYFYKRKISIKNVFSILRYLGLPMIAMVTYIYFKAPNFEDIVFGGISNRASSGGFGPNQVATILGVGMFCYAVFILAGKKLTGYRIVDILLFFYIFYRALITLSRGGLITGVIAILVFAIFYFLSRRNSFILILKYLAICILVVIPIWTFTATVTDGMLVNRYTNKNARGDTKDDVSAGRVKIFMNEIDGFVKNPFFGIGVGTGKFKRIDELGKKVASHNEMSRLIGEHGVIGLLILILLIIIPIRSMTRQQLQNRGYLSAFILFWFLTINHSAMRLAMPAFMYGLSTMDITYNKSILLVQQKKI
jgi:O-antigen ligase